jgi:hypothetical protein
MAKIKELHFEDAIEQHLIASGGWTKGSLKDFDRKTAFVSKDFFAFIEATQPETSSGGSTTTRVLTGPVRRDPETETGAASGPR